MAVTDEKSTIGRLNRLQTLEDLEVSPSSSSSTITGLAQNLLLPIMEPNEIDLSQGFSRKEASRSCSVFNSLPTSGDFCHLLITFANSLDPDQARQNVGLIWIQTVDTLMVLKKNAAFKELNMAQ